MTPSPLNSDRSISLVRANVLALGLLAPMVLGSELGEYDGHGVGSLVLGSPVGALGVYDGNGVGFLENGAAV